ncbi:MAG: RNA methyltransferase, TrmH family [Treponematales bacterium]
MTLDDITIVLCRPAEAGNIGAVCRAMKNMGLTRLALALPERAPHRGDTQIARSGGAFPEDAADKARARAVHASDVWESAAVFPSLEAALGDSALAVGITRRRGQRRKQTTMTPRETAAFLAARPGPAALVFGNERTGLDDSELSLCGLASHIPASPAFPSLNLSHAVQIYGYELFLALSGAEPVKGQWTPLGRGGLETAVTKIADSLELLGFYQRRGRREQERFLRDFFARAALTEREAAYLAGLAAKAAHLAVRGSGGWIVENGE